MTHSLWKGRGPDANRGEPNVESRGRLPAQLKQYVTAKQKQRQVQPSSKVAPPLQGGSGPSGVKLSKWIRMPTSCARKLRDAYVSFMISMAGKHKVNMVAGAYTAWPCATGLSRYPGRSPRVQMSDEEVACSSLRADETPTAAKGMQRTRPPAWSRTAVFPLYDQTQHLDILDK